MHAHTCTHTCTHSPNPRHCRFLSQVHSEPKVRNFEHHAAGKQDILWLDVAVSDAGRMEELQASQEGLQHK